MRSSKSRSRSKQNRPRSLGNIVNRVFDSSGPEGKVRGTPQQIIDKYQVLARDAQLSNDRVAAENFLQHGEHYTRMLAEAQREQAAEQEARQRQSRPQNAPQFSAQEAAAQEAGGSDGAMQTLGGEGAPLVEGTSDEALRPASYRLRTPYKNGRGEPSFTKEGASPPRVRKAVRPAPEEAPAADEGAALENAPALLVPSSPLMPPLPLEGAEQEGVRRRARTTKKAESAPAERAPTESAPVVEDAPKKAAPRRRTSTKKAESALTESASAPQEAPAAEE